MILTNRLFTRREPSKDAKSVYIFCEGKKREYQYFGYFQGLDSRINILVHPLKGIDDNSPMGLYRLAKQCLIASDSNPAPQFEILKGDEVWFVIDTDSWGDKVGELRSCCMNHKGWHIAQSNPCFEVWLYFHIFGSQPSFQWRDECVTWKNYLDKNIPGGFSSQKHPILLKHAITHSKKCFISNGGVPKPGCTEVHNLGELIFKFVGKKLESLVHRIDS